MNWITKNNYTIKRKFNQINNKNIKVNNKIKQAFNGLDCDKNPLIHKNQINYNIYSFNQNNNNHNNNYINMYYQINSTENLEEQLKKGENFVHTNLNSKYILSELKEF